MFTDHRLLKEISDKRTVSVYEDHLAVMLLVKNRRRLCIVMKRIKTNFVRFTEKDGLVYNTCYGFKEDKKGEYVYVFEKWDLVLSTPSDSITLYKKTRLAL